MITIKQQMNWETDWMSEADAKGLGEILEQQGIEHSYYCKSSLWRLTIKDIGIEDLKELGLFTVELWND